MSHCKLWILIIYFLLFWWKCFDFSCICISEIYWQVPWDQTTENHHLHRVEILPFQEIFLRWHLKTAQPFLLASRKRLVEEEVRACCHRTKTSRTFWKETRKRFVLFDKYFTEYVFLKWQLIETYILREGL